MTQTMSSKFNRYPTPRLRPPICFPPPGSCWPRMAVGMPWFLSGYYHWKEPHVAAHINRYSVCQVKRIPGAPYYYSWYDWPNGWIGISLDPSNQPLRWHVTMTCHIDPLMFDHVQWRFIASISPDRFDTGLLTSVHIKDIDFREVHFRGPYLQWAAP